MTSSIRFPTVAPIMSAFSPASARSSSNPFRRNKQAQILGIDNPNFGTSSDDVSSIRSGLSYHSAGVERKGSNKSRTHSSHVPDADAASIAYSKHSSVSGDDASSFTTSMYNTHSPIEEDDNPFEQELLEEEEDSLDELEPQPGLRRRRTVPSKAGSVVDANNDNPWRTSTKLGNHPSLRRPKHSDSADANSIPLKAQKTLGISKRGKLITESEYRRSHALSPEMDNVAPKAQKMLGIPSNPFQKKQQDENRQTFGDELEQHGAKGPTSLPRRPLDMDEFKRMLLSGDREYMTPGHFHPFFNRDSSSNTDASSLSRSSLLSAADSHVDTPRSSHDLASRPGLPRIATDPYDTSHGYNSVSPSELADNSPASLNKPLPPPPPKTFELAGSYPAPRLPDPSTRRRLQQSKHADPRRNQADQIHELPATMEFGPVELPAEPVQFSQPAMAQDKPGSQFMPIELPAREATPIEAPQRQSYRPSPLHIASQARSPPAVPPPRRGGSNRNTMVLPQGIPELAEGSPDHTKQSFHQQDSQDPRAASGSSDSNEDRQHAKPPIPPPRSAARQSNLAPSSLSPQHDASSFLSDGTETSVHDSTDKETSTDAESKGQNARDMISANLPKLQTQVGYAPSVSASDHIVSALSINSQARHTISPSKTVSVISTDGMWPSSSGGANLASIATAVAENSQFTIPGNDSVLGPGRRPSRQETLEVLEKVVRDETKTEKEKTDILADLGALQREVDALRRSYERNQSTIPEEEEEESGNGHDLTAPAPATTTTAERNIEDVPEPLQQKRQDQDLQKEESEHRESIIEALGAGIEGKTFLTESTEDSEH